MKLVPNPEWVDAPYEIAYRGLEGVEFHVPLPPRRFRSADALKAQEAMQKNDSAELNRLAIPMHIEAE